MCEALLGYLSTCGGSEPRLASKPCMFDSEELSIVFGSLMIMRPAISFGTVSLKDEPGLIFAALKQAFEDSSLSAWDLDTPMIC